MWSRTASPPHHPLGEVVTGLMKDKFHDIVDYDFTADMESRLDKVESGEGELEKGPAGLLPGLQPGDEPGGKRSGWHPDQGPRRGLRRGLRRVRAADGGEIRAVRPLFGLPGLPECTFTKPLVIEMPGKCPKCGSRLLKKTSRNGYTYYGCEHKRGQTGPGLRLYDLGCAGEGDLPRVRPDHVQEVRPGALRSPSASTRPAPPLSPRRSGGLPQKRKPRRPRPRTRPPPAQETAPAEEAAEKAPAKAHRQEGGGGEEDRREKAGGQKTAKAGEAKPAAKKTAAKKTKKAPEETPGEPEETP